MVVASDSGDMRLSLSSAVNLRHATGPPRAAFLIRQCACRAQSVWLRQRACALAGMQSWWVAPVPALNGISRTYSSWRPAGGFLGYERIASLGERFLTLPKSLFTTRCPIRAQDVGSVTVSLEFYTFVHLYSIYF